MSECVVRMDMPKDKDCLLNFNLPIIGPWCWIEDRECDYCKTNNRPDWCPIICSLPEGHGRLVDGDALKEWFIEQIDYYKRFDGPNCSMMVSAYEAVCQVINDAPTIVPAERSET